MLQPQQTWDQFTRNLTNSLIKKVGELIPKIIVQFLNWLENEGQQFYLQTICFENALSSLDPTMMLITDGVLREQAVPTQLYSGVDSMSLF